MNVHATINGYATLGVRVELRRNGQASILEAELPGPAGIAAGDTLDVELRDSRSARSFRQFVCRRVDELGDGRARIHASDRRQDWDCPAHVAINVPAGDGSAWREGEPLSAQRALERLFMASGLAEPAPTLPGQNQVPITLRSRGSLAAGVSDLLSQVGQTLTVDDSGEFRFAGADSATDIDASTVIESETSRTRGRVRVSGGPPIELRTLTDWEAVLPDDEGEIRPLSQVLDEWGLSEKAARQACLSDGGFEKLLARTTPNAGNRLAILKRHACRMFRATDPHARWLPVGGVSDSGELHPPTVVATFTRAKGVAPDHPQDERFETLPARPIESFEWDGERGLLYLPYPPYESAGSNDATLQSRRLIGDPKIEFTVGVPADRPPLRYESAGEGRVLHVDASHLVAVFRDGECLNRARLMAEAGQLALRFARGETRSRTVLAGVPLVHAAGTCETIVISAGEDGLTTTVQEAPAAVQLSHERRKHDGMEARVGQALPSGLHQPINAFRSGPLVIRADNGTPEGESVIAARAVHRRDDTGALEFDAPGTMAFPFFIDSDDASKFGRWFFVAGAETTDDGRIRVLGPDDRHADLDAEDFIQHRHTRPLGLRGLLVSPGESPEFVDVGPMVSDSRGHRAGAASSLVYDLDGAELSKRKRGGLQFLSVLALSPSHQRDGTRERGWVPALNLREGDTTDPEVSGRGLFAEGGGRDLGRLTAKLQGGPILADPAACSKHLYGQTSDDDGLYREASGHISTEAFYKFPGDPVHDAPLKFYREPFAGGVPHWPPYEAQIKYDATERHPWNHKLREGYWKIQYRVPFFPEIPPTWTPPIEPPIDPPVDPPIDDPPKIHTPAMQTVPRELFPIVTNHNIWAPSHDWIPAPSERDSEREIPMRGPSITSEGWSGEQDGVPDPSMGGGCIYLPPGLPLPDALNDNGERKTYVTLHPQVVLAFGYPGFGGDPQGHVHTGWAIALASDGNLQMAPRDESAEVEDGLGRGLHVAGHMRLGPPGATYGEAQALRLGAASGEGIAFGADVNLYRDAADTLRTDDDFVVGGKLSVEGLIDPTGLELEAQASNPGNVAANTLWINSADGRLYFGGNKLAFAGELQEEQP